MTRRKFLWLGGAGVATLAVGGTAIHALRTEDVKGRILIIGGGAAGCSFAARLMRRVSHPDITLIDPSDKQFYQPGFTFIASGIFQANEVWMPQSECLPKGEGFRWVKDSVVALDPVNQTARTAKGNTYAYDFLVLCPGIKLCWDEVEGFDLKQMGKGNAYSIYDFQGAQKIWPAIQQLVKEGGRGVFTDTYTKHKCGGAPKKICLLTEDWARKNNARDKIKLDYFCSEKALYDVPYYTPRLLEIYEERHVGLSVNCRVKGIDTEKKQVYLERHEKRTVKRTDPETHEVTEVDDTQVTPFGEDYDLLSFVPPQSVPDFVKESGLSWTEGKLASGGWVMVDQYTFVHQKFPNVISLGDCAGLPTSKTSAAIRKQLPIAVENLLQIMQGKEPTHRYNGYACCPIVTDYSHVLLCEFDYEKKPDISFPFSLLDMSKEQYSAFLLKRYFLKPMFFHAMLKGLM